MQASVDYDQFQGTHDGDKDPRKKRRSKNDPNGRTSKCKHCDKTYLSDIALNNHIKTKHAHLVEIVNRGRGRPRKSIPNAVNDTQISEVKYRNFFESSIRKKIHDQQFDLISSCKENFDNIFTKYRDKLFKNVTSVEDFTFIGNGAVNTCDAAFWKYILFIYERSNREYFDFAFKFVILFRECVNLKRGETYSQVETAEIVPDLCNDFVGDFLDHYDYFGLDVNELIEIIQHCCQWLWENHFTTSRLSLISG